MHCSHACCCHGSKSSLHICCPCPELRLEGTMLWLSAFTKTRLSEPFSSNVVR
jgi:hypothetical protein